MTKTPQARAASNRADIALSPLNFDDSMESTGARSTPTKHHKTDAHLSKILGKARTTSSTSTGARRRLPPPPPPDDDDESNATLEAVPPEDDAVDDEETMSEATLASTSTLDQQQQQQQQQLPPQVQPRTSLAEVATSDASSSRFDTPRASMTSDSTLSPDAIWDESPNSPPFRTFEDRLAFARALEEGGPPHKNKSSKKPRPPLTSQSEPPAPKRRGRPSDIEEG